MANKRVLSIVAHPDDHICFAGTVLKLRKRGYDYFEIVLSDAEESGMINKKGKRKKKVNKEEHLRERFLEFKKASKILGTKEVFRMKLENLNVKYNKKVHFKLIKTIRSIRPDIAIIHHRKDYILDHVEANRIAIEALRGASYKYALHLGKWFKVPCVFEFEGVCDIEPDILIDVTDFYNLKDKILGLYTCQMKEGEWEFQLFKSVPLHRGARFQKDKPTYAEAFEIPKELPILKMPVL